MIMTKQDYLLYLTADRIALGETRISPRWFGDEIWKFQRLLRKAEYLKNCKSGLFWQLYYQYVQFKRHYLGIFLGLSIPLNVFGPGLSIVHYGTVIVNSGAVVGANCRIHGCVNIGSQAGNVTQAPVIGDNVYIGPGAKLFGTIKIADGIAIGANAVVNKSFFERNITIAGMPARKISERGAGEYVIDALAAAKLQVASA
ncbi:hypothetical protein [Azotosporobacter soli]|uniref:serine O-acetyltransferase n=1 Tax=Azotosporobacter soli TaxID=3055040 RepID=UPI0031FF4576